MWTHTQRKALLALAILLSLWLAIEAYRKPIVLPDPPVDGPRAAEIQDRLDPNTADAAALSAIPNLGEKRAAQIVDYRENYQRTHPHTIAFRSIDDLRNIKGFGPATAANLSPFLTFTDHPATAPANNRSP